MFNKSQSISDKEKKPDDSRSPANTENGGPTARPASGGSAQSSMETRIMSPSLVTQETSITGNLRSKSEIRIEGEIKGEIHCASLVVGETAKITGGVWAENVLVQGGIEGKVYGGSVTLEASCHVQGDIEHESLAIEQGAHFEGGSFRASKEKSPSKTGGETVSLATETKSGEDSFVEKFFPDIKKYSGNFDRSSAEKIVAYLGKGVLSQKDASLVSCSDPKELSRVRENFCKKKLGLKMSDVEINEVLADICKMMSAERHKSRVTFYYLTAEMTGTLTKFE